MRNIQYLTIDINKKTQQDVTANEGETGSRFLKIKITDNNVPIDLTGTKVYLYALKSDNTKLFNLVEIENATQGIVLAELTSQLLISSGVVKLTLVITEGSNKLISKEFTLKVDGSIFDDDAIASTNEFTALTNALGQVQNIDNRFNEVNAQFNTVAKKEDVARISTGTPLFASSITEMSDTTRNYVNTTDGYLYNHNGGNWVKTSILYQAAGLQDGSINEKSTSFINVSPNLFEIDKCIQFKVVNESNTVDNSVFNPVDATDSYRWVSQIFDIKPNVTYRFNQPITGTNKVYIYSALGRRIETLTATKEETGSYSFKTTQLNAKYFRLNLFDTYVVFDKFMLVEGNMPYEFIPFNQNWFKDNIKLKTKNILDKSITLSKLDDDVKSYLSNYDKLYVGRGVLDEARSTIFNYNLDNNFLNFSFITDIHANSQISDNNIELFIEFNNEHFLDFACCGGDTVTTTSSTSKVSAINNISKIQSKFNKINIPFFNVLGNHDLNAKSTEYLSNSQLSMLLNINNSEKNIYNKNDRYGLYYYSDFERNKIRVIFLNNYHARNGELSGLQSIQMQWLCDEALILNKDDKKDWQILFINHNMLDGTSLSCFNRIIDRFKNGTSMNFEQSDYVVYSNSFVEQGVMSENIIGLIHGHTHEDSVDISNGYPAISVKNGYCINGEEGTINEFCFSVFTIDTQNRKIYETRVGKGNNRIFNY